MKMSAGFAGTVFDAISKAAPPDARAPLHVARGISKLKGRMEVHYKKENALGDAFKDVPNLAGLMQELSNCLRRPGLKAVRKHLKGLEKLSAGVKSVALEGLPMNWEVVAIFHNFHPSPVL